MSVKAILINPTQRTIEYINIPTNKGEAKLEELQKCVDGYICGVGYINPTLTECGFKDDFIYVNDDGLFNSSFDYVKIKGYLQQVYRGNMLIVGSDGEGGTNNVKMTVNEAKKLVTFIAKENIREHI